MSSTILLNQCWDKDVYFLIEDIDSLFFSFRSRSLAAWSTLGGSVSIESHKIRSLKALNASLGSE